VEVVEIDATQRPDLAKVWGVMSVDHIPWINGEARRQ
jgi:hypothetical protein